MTEQQIPLPFRKPARLSAAQRKAMMQTKLQDYPVDQATREAKRKHHVIEQFKNEQLSLWGESAALQIKASEGFGFVVSRRVSATCWPCLGAVEEWVERIGRKHEQIRKPCNTSDQSHSIHWRRSIGIRPTH